MADEQTPPTLLFHLSDIHFGLEDNEALDWAQREIAARRPQAVAITGDLTMRARRREFAAACRWIQALDAPVTVEVGNHDMPYFNLVERFFSPYRRFHAIEGLVEREIQPFDQLNRGCARTAVLSGTIATPGRSISRSTKPSIA